MKWSLVIAAAVVTLNSGCGKESNSTVGEVPAETPAESPAKANAVAELKKSLQDIETRLKNAASAEAFTAVSDKCMTLSITAATEGIDVSQNDDYKAICQVGYSMAYADAAIAGSKPDAESKLCMGATMALALIADNPAVKEQAAAKSKSLDKACGYEEE